MTKNGPSMQRFNRELAVTALPLVVAMVLLGLFTIPNYLHAREWSREANALRAVANESAARQDNLLDMQREIERLRADLAQRGRTLPATPDQGALLASIARSADAKGVTGSQSKSGKLAAVAVPGLAGGKATRRAVDVEMTGSFDALFAAVSNAERLDALVTVRSIDLTRNPAADGGVVEAKLVFDEYFNERAAEPRAAAARATTGKAGG
jgi:Tfp pilus assembly protein PilO